MRKQLHEYVQVDEVRGFSREWVDIPQKQNRLIVFKGSLPHYAAPIRSLKSRDDPRVSLLVNVWDHLPIARFKLNGCSTMLPSEFRALCKFTEKQWDQLNGIINLLSPEEISEVMKFLMRNRATAL